MSHPGFLKLPRRAVKPRAAGLTHVLDKGLGRLETESVLSVARDYIDLWKLGWGSAYVEEDVAEKVALLAGNEVRACVGGTLLEVAWSQGRASECLDWAQRVGFPCVEVSNGAVDMSRDHKKRLIAQAAERFEVVAEVGSKDPSVVEPPGQWADAALADLDAGASWIVTEGRESGTTGIYHPDKSVRPEVVEATVTAVGLNRLIFEAPNHGQRAWLVRHYGPDVGLGNVPHGEVVGLEALRLGLRADTVSLAVGPGPDLQEAP